MNKKLNGPCQVKAQFTFISMIEIFYNTDVEMKYVEFWNPTWLL